MKKKIINNNIFNRIVSFEILFLDNSERGPYLTGGA